MGKALWNWLLWLLLRGEVVIATNTTTESTTATTTTFTTVTDTSSTTSVTTLTSTISQTTSMTSSTVTTVTRTKTITSTVSSSTTTLTSSTSQTQTFLRPMDAGLRSGAVPLCTPEILWAVQNDLFSEVSRYAGIGENLDCKDVHGELFIFLALERCPEAVLADVVQSLGSSPSLFARNGSGFTPLLAAASRGLLLTRTLLSRGANRSVVDQQGRSLLHHAASWPLLSLVTLDLPVTLVLRQLLWADAVGDLPLHRALRGGRYGEISALLTRWRKAPTRQGKDDSSDAWRNADLALLEELILLQVDVLALDGHGAWPWHTVAGLVGSATGTLQRLAGLSQVPLESQDARGRTAMHYAAASGDRENVQWLISQGANLRVKDQQKLMPLQLALANGHLHLLDLFERNNGFALEAAAGFGNVTIVQQMILEQGYSPYVMDERGRTPIFESVEKGQVKVAEFMASLNVSLTRLDQQGISVLGAAALAEQPAAVQFLLQSVSVMQRMANSSTALHLAARKQQALTVEILLRAGAEADAVDYRNRSALHFSANAAVVEALLTGNATAEWRDVLGVMPLHLAAAEGRVSAVEGLLASRKTQVDALDGGGRTALHWAVVGGHIETVRTLLRWCGTSRPSNSGEMPSQLAPPGELRDLLVIGTDDQCQCDCGKFPFDALLSAGSWQQCSTTVRCRYGGASDQALRCARNESVPLSSPSTGRWHPAELEINCKAVSVAWRRSVGCLLLAALSIRIVL
ncbi:unnamed protein product [Cladocopium goreaui]|uniref:ANK_REP_REGION domain-containing protein n=2 Tax=Cladocopium goreaui TaxID=2562237 RepID=A0A9P1CG76_9DINO|nr:unnamed protein product [Cladocopium goreaui]